MAPSSRKLTRDGLLAVLHSMDITFPSTTKIQEDDLNKRLSQALDAAQRYRDVIGNSIFDESTGTPWPADKDLMEGTQRGTIWEIARNQIYGASQSENKGTFAEMRQIVMGLAHNYKLGIRNICMTESLGVLEDWGVYVRILNIFIVKDTPVFLVAFKEVDGKGAGSMREELEKLIPEARESGHKIGTLRTTEYERLSMLKLLGMNAKRLSVDLHPDEVSVAKMLGLKLSFLLPLAPLSLKDLGRLATNSGCEWRTVAQVNIPPKECQKVDWPNHKATCRSLKGGTWKTITFDLSNAKKSMFLYNYHETPQDALKRLDTDPSSVINAAGGPPPDIHNGKTFLVKFQISLFQFKENAHMLLYDRQRSFQVLWKRINARDLFDEAEDQLGDELKMYRWARRVGDYQLEVCFDRRPASNPPW
ncbi:hypothetical protein D9613_007243 [Agrocybe pediades]|uniref:Uncharacterized protein n=1 Tax=Agrocybe pediades TaxID=84607 RepID=A0A8H4VIR3_9AGAR|nr:hypothetical protein D9613_007243 [Agrocybe pediades]